MDKGRKTVIIGVSGGIAVYKVADVASKLAQGDLDVHVIMSPGALEFVQPLTFAAVTRNPVIYRLFPSVDLAGGEQLYPHLYPASHADLFLLAPATADMMAKLACGIADDPVCAAALALPASCPRLFCPAMHVHMWAQPVVRRNAARLQDDGWQQLGPESGTLACGATGEGRMSEPAAIIAAVHAALGQ